MEDIEALKNSIILAISETTSLDGLEELRVFELGKSGRITNMMKSLGNMKEIERKIAGKELKVEFENSWAHIRKSNTEPIIRIYTEAVSQKAAKKLATKFSDVIKTFI